jgi:hypothetical protein
VGVGNDPLNPHLCLHPKSRPGILAKKWQARNSGIRLSTQEFGFGFVFEPKDAKNLFAATGEEIFRSTDGGKNWEKILEKNGV